ncbi:MAG: hypothetical protein JWQ03_166 [Variovorax sp.]|nr:hypothetical protein [Variovorax sp.]
MTQFVHVNQPADHPGVQRAETAYAHLRTVRGRFDGARGLATLLLAAMVSALLVIADSLISSWTDGGLLVAWVGLWAVAFAALALFAGSSRAIAAWLTRAWRAGAQRRAAARNDAQLLRFAHADHRVMADLQAAMTRADNTAPSPAGATQVAGRPEADWLAQYKPLYGADAVDDAAQAHPAQAPYRANEAWLSHYAPMFDWRAASRA